MKVIKRLAYFPLILKLLSMQVYASPSNTAQNILPLSHGKSPCKNFIKNFSQMPDKKQTDTMERTKIEKRKLLQNPERVKKVQARYQSPAIIEKFLNLNKLYPKVINRAHSKTSGTGDFIRIKKLGNNRLAILMGDFEGHGDKAARESLRLQHIMDKKDFLRKIFSNKEEKTLSASEILENIDTNTNFDELGLFMSNLIINTKTGELEFAGGGMPALKIIKTNGKILDLKAKGAYIGSSMFTYSESNNGTLKYKLERGDTVLMMSDGITDAIHINGNLMETELNKIIQNTAKTTATSITKNIEKSIANFTDDTSLIAFTWSP